MKVRPLIVRRIRMGRWLHGKRYDCYGHGLTKIFHMLLKTDHVLLKNNEFNSCIKNKVVPMPLVRVPRDVFLSCELQIF